MVKVAKMLKKHLSGLRSYFEHRITNAGGEGLNSKMQSLYEFKKSKMKAVVEF